MGIPDIQPEHGTGRVIRTKWIDQKLIGYLDDGSITVLIGDTTEYTGLTIVK